MTTMHDPLQLPRGLELPNRLMKAAVSEALADAAHSPDARLMRLYRTWFTKMIKHGVDDDPLVDELLAALPRVMLKRLQPDAAATALADDLAHRSPRVREPARWKPISMDYSPTHWIHTWPAASASWPH
ncbi:hypothetical protein [Mycobacterium sp. 050134]|uniref:hypothetical protein n=1 Tax=Mycobacterium sp. 050134 TaxID=3096111 RepID=UPI002EDA1489